MGEITDHEIDILCQSVESGEEARHWEERLEKARAWCLQDHNHDLQQLHAELTRPRVPCLLEDEDDEIPF